MATEALEFSIIFPEKKKSKRKGKFLGPSCEASDTKAPSRSDSGYGSEAMSIPGNSTSSESSFEIGSYNHHHHSSQSVEEVSSILSELHFSLSCPSPSLSTTDMSEQQLSGRASLASDDSLIRGIFVERQPKRGEWGEAPLYSYDFLLDRAYEKMEREREGRRGRKNVLPAPLLLRLGSRKVCFANFSHVSASLNRSPPHLLHFILDQLQTSGFMDAQNRLILRGRFSQKSMETVLRTYIKMFVACAECKSWNTCIEREAASKLNFLKCRELLCGSHRSVPKTKTCVKKQSKDLG